ncbi:hypothetical protein M1307_00675 [Patescibacteria group bacterium]|nr:hypothetical protein [Patescibacteria group bacterium]
MTERIQQKSSNAPESDAQQIEGMKLVNFLSGIGLEDWELSPNRAMPNVLYRFTTFLNLESEQVAIRVDYKGERERIGEEPKMEFTVQASTFLPDSIELFEYSFPQGSDEYSALDELGSKILSAKLEGEKRKVILREKLFSLIRSASAQNTDH